jgi:hypothetical protein
MLSGDDVVVAYAGVLEAISVKPFPRRLMERMENVATPEETATAEPPLSVPALGFVPMARLTWVPLSPVSTLPLASSTATVTAGATAASTAVFVGCCSKTNLEATPGVMLNVDDVAGVNVGVLEALRV